MRLLEDLVVDGKIQYGVVQPGNYDPTGTPMVRVKDLRYGRIAIDEPLRIASAISERHHRTVLAGGEVLVSLVGSVGLCAVAGPELHGWNVARAIAVLRPVPDVGPSWLRLCIESEPVQAQVRERLNTTVQATLNLADLKTVRVPLPAKTERTAIAAVLGALDDKIAANAALGATARRLSNAYFEAIPSQRRTRKKLGDILSLKYGKALPATLRIRGDVPVVGSGGIIGWHNEALVDGPAVVVGRKGSVGATYWIPSPAYPIDTTYYVRAAPGIPLLYTLFLLRSLDLAGMNSDSAVPGLNRTEALALDVWVPDAESMSHASSTSAALFDLADQHDRESRTLAELRDTLLPALMSGHLRVKDAERAVEDAV